MENASSVTHQFDVEQLKAGQRLLAIKKARESLLEFTRLTLPHPEDPDDVTKSLYDTAPHHHQIADLLEKVESGEVLRAIITMPPRHGKSELASRRFPTWFMGRDPYRQVIFSTYSDTFAEDFGRKAREIIDMPQYRQVFPTGKLRKESRAANRMEFTEGGMLVFVGAGGAITGRGADLLLIDDPYKNRQDAESDTVRGQIWDWFTSTAYTRLMPGGRIVIILTRWHEDDIVGRIFNPDYVAPEEAAKWTILELPAIIDENGEDERALWPARYSLETLKEIRSVIGPRDWVSLYQQKPAPEDGDYFKKDWLLTYQPDDLPKNLEYYIASDHAVSKNGDYSCFIPVGIDQDGTIWVLPEVYWDREEDTNVIVDEMLGLMRHYEPFTWWAERGHISKSIGPFLRKRMDEENIYVYVDDEMVPATKKTSRARSIQGRMSMGKVKFPAFATWWPTAKSELLKFPNGKHDDFVDALSWIGIGLDKIINASDNSESRKADLCAVGSIAWIKQQSEYENEQNKVKFGGM